jgi:hypothetical protein
MRLVRIFLGRRLGVSLTGLSGEAAGLVNAPEADDEINDLNADLPTFVDDGDARDGDDDMALLMRRLALPDDEGEEARGDEGELPRALVRRSGDDACRMACCLCRGRCSAPGIGVCTPRATACEDRVVASAVGLETSEAERWCWGCCCRWNWCGGIRWGAAGRLVEVGKGVVGRN